MANNGAYLTGYQMARNHGFTGTEDEWYDIMVHGWQELSDHRKLRGRAEEDQHPMSAISGLVEELDALKARIAALEEETE